MATVTTTSVTNPLQYPNTTLIDYTTFDGYWYVMVRASTANTFEVWRTNTGASWALYVSLVRANIQEIGSIYTSPQGYISWTYRTSESGEDRVYYRRLTISTATWSSEVLLTGNSNGGVAGSVWGGMDLAQLDYGPSNAYQAGIVIVAQTSNGGAWVFGFNALPGAAPQANNGVMAGNRQFLPVTAVSGHHSPSIDLEHAGNGKTATVSHLWATYGRNQVLLAKIAWHGYGWTLPTSAVAITAVTTNRDYIPGRWDGAQFIMARYSGSTVVVYERNRSNTSTTTRTTPAHTQGVVRSVSVNYNSTSRNPRVFAVGTSTDDLYYVDYDRSLGTWGSWTLVSSTDITGAAVDNFSPRRGTYSNAKHDILTAHTGVNIVHTALGLTFAPLTPTWVFSAVPYVDGSAADVAAALLLDWQFNDPDPNDTQSAYALSRQIGSGTIEYWQASTGTWQATEQKNTSSTTQVTLPTGFVDRFDLGVVSWTPTASTFAATTVQSRSGGKAAILTTVGTPTQAFARYELPVTASTSYSAELWGLSVGGYADFGCAIDWYTSGHVYISTSASAGTALSAGVWGRRSVTATAPGTAAFAQFGPTVGSNPPASTVVYVDDTSFGATPTPWAAASDATHTYRVKTWDFTDVASNYSASLSLVPSAKVNPVITSPADSSTWVTDQLTITWTASEQTAFQAKLIFVGITLEDTGKRVSGSTTWTFDEVLLDTWNYSIQLWTWNAEGLQSDMTQNNISVRFVTPRVPTVVATPNPTNGYITVTVTNPAAAAYVAAGTAATGNNVSLNPALPAGLATDDLLLTLSAIENSGTGVPVLPTPAYTQLALFGNVGLFGKLAGASEGAPSCTYTGGVAGAATSAQTAAFRRAALAALGSPFTQLNGSAQNIAYLGGTPATANCILILIVWKQDGAATVLSTPAGFTKISDIINATGQSIAWYYQIQTTATAISSGTVTVTSGVSAISRSVLVAISGVPLVLRNDIWRIRNGSFGDQIRVLEGVPANGSGNDFRAVSRQEYLYQAYAIGDNGTSQGGLFTL